MPLTKAHSAPRRKWRMVPNGGCAPPPICFSTLPLASPAPARIKRDCNGLANVAYVGNIAPRREPFLDLLFDGPAPRRQWLVLVPPDLLPIPLVIGAQC